MAATMPDLGRSEDRRSLESGQGQTPATRADGPSACPGDSSHERGRVGASDNPWDMQQAAKSTRVRNAGEDLLPRPGSAQRSSALGWATARVPRKRRAGCPYANTCGRRGRGETPCRSARPYGGDEEQNNRQALGPDQTRGDGATSTMMQRVRAALPGVARTRRGERSRRCLTIESVTNDGRFNPPVLPATCCGFSKIALTQKGAIAIQPNPVAL